MTKDEVVKAYDQLVQFRQQNQLQKTSENPGKVETHHILPISCGGEDIPENRINLLAKEHFMAHVYLWIIHHEDEFHYSTMCALNMMVKGTLDGSRKELRDFILMSEEYQKAREEYAQFTSETIGKKISGEKNGAYGKHWYYDPVTLSCAMFFEEDVPDRWKCGKKHNKSFRQHVSEATKNTVWIHSIDNLQQKHLKLAKANILLSSGQWEKGKIVFPKQEKEITRNSKTNKKKSHKKLKMLHWIAEAKKLDQRGFFDCQKTLLYNGVVNRNQVRRYLLVTGHHCCAKCGKNDCKLTVHSKDGNCRNLAIDNYEFLCRECYLASGTAGFTGRSMHDVLVRKKTEVSN